MQPPPPGVEPLAAALQLTVYQVQVPADRIADLSVEALSANAATPAALQKALAAIGPTRTLYQVEQTVDLAAREIVTIGAKVPFLRSTQQTPEGRQTQVEYQNVGLKIAASNAPAPDRGGQARGFVRLAIEISAMSASDVAISENLNARTFQAITQTLLGALDSNQPIVVVTADGTSPDKNGAVPAYISRAVLRSRS